MPSSYAGASRTSWPSARARRRSSRRSAVSRRTLPVARVDAPPRRVPIASPGSTPSIRCVEHLDVDLRLRVAAHAAEDERRAPSRKPIAGMSVCIGRLPGANALVVRGVERERRAPVVEVDPPLGNVDARAEGEEVRLDQADEQPVAVGRAEVRGAAPLRAPGARVDGARRVDARRAERRSTRRRGAGRPGPACARDP